MVKIARRTEADVEYNQQFSVRTKGDTTNVTTAISHATCMTAIDLNAKASSQLPVPATLHAWFPNIVQDARSLHVLRMNVHGVS